MHLSQALKKNGHYTSRDLTKWFCSMATLGHMLQNGWKLTWRCLNGKSYPNHRIHHILPHPIITCSNWWYMAWLSSSFILMKMQKNGLTRSWPLKDVLFFQHGIQMLPERWEKVLASDGQHSQWHIANKFLKIKFYFSWKISKNLFKVLIYLIIIIRSCRQHGYPYRSSPLGGLQGHILYLHRAAVCMFELVILLLLGHMWGSIGVYHKLGHWPCG